jgi:hypothetical protein
MDRICTCCHQSRRKSDFSSTQYRWPNSRRNRRCKVCIELQKVGPYDLVRELLSLYWTHTLFYFCVLSHSHTYCTIARFIGAGVIDVRRSTLRHHWYDTHCLIMPVVVVGCDSVCICVTIHVCYIYCSSIPVSSPTWTLFSWRPIVHNWFPSPAHLLFFLFFLY